MSITISALIIIIVLKVLDWMGIKIGAEELNQFIQTGGTIIFGLIAWWGRWRKGDVTWFGARKKIKTA